MTWRDKSEIMAARDFAKRFGANRVIVLYTLPDGSFGGASYGADGKLCTQAGKMLDLLLDPFEDAILEVVT